MAPEETKSAEQHAQDHAEEQKKAAEEMKEFEQGDEVPKDPRDWPDGKAKYITYALEDDAPYGEGTTAKLGPAEVNHHEDGSVTVGGEEVDDPSQYKGEPIKGGVMEQIEKSKQRYSEEGGTTSADGEGSEGGEGADGGEEDGEGGGSDG